MSEYLTRKQQQGIRNRFNEAYLDVSGQPVPSWRHGGTHTYTCQMCKTFKIVGKGAMHALRSWEMQRAEAGELSEYAVKTYDNIRTAHEHLQTVHEVSPCSFCNEMVTRRGLKRHQSAPACQGELRRYAMRNKGLEILDCGPDAFSLARIMADKLQELENFVHWEDEEIIFSLEKIAETARREMLQLLGVRPALTAWEKKAGVYTREYWASPLLVQLVDQGDFSYKDSESQTRILSMLNNWIDADLEGKEAILGILELQNDVRNAP